MRAGRPVLRCGVVGAGRIGRVHATNLARRVEGAELVALAEADAATLEHLASELRVPRAFARFEDLVVCDEVDAVIVCTPTDTHFPIIMAAAARGKPIFTEKPVDLALERIDAIIAEVDGRGVPLMVGLQRRFNPDFFRVHEMVRTGAIGELHLLRLTSRDAVPPPESFIASSGGLFLDMTIHDLDMARFIAGSEVAEIYARAAVLVDPMFERAGDWDTAVVTLTFAGGALATIDNSRRTAYGQDQRLEVFGSAGMLTVGNHVVDRHVHWDETGAHSARLLSYFPERYAEAYHLEMQAFVDAVREGRPMPVTAHDGRQAVVLALAARQSARENRPVACDAVGS